MNEKEEILSVDSNALLTKAFNEIALCKKEIMMKDLIIEKLLKERGEKQ